MDNDVVIKVEHVSKKYCKSLKRSMLYGLEDIGRNLFGLNSRSEKLRRSEFWAVDDASFEVKKGESLGLIGPNGSGKSTLLKMLNGIFWPDKGKITVKGRVGALIEVGAGFHPLLTGRENVYVNAAILGMTKEQVDAKFDDIIEFADIGDFIDAPVKSYSSGMYVRLGFAIAAHCEPDILLVDEVLAVGDIGFQRRCMRHITKMMDRCAVILVSHSPNIIRFMCDRVLFLDTGKTLFLGSASEGVDKYIDYMDKLTLPKLNAETSESKYDPQIELKSLSFFDKNYNEIVEVDAGETLVVECTFTVARPIRQAIIGFGFSRDGLERSFECYSSQVNDGQYFDLSEGEHRFRITIPKISLGAGMYNVGVCVSEKTELAYHAWNNFKYIYVKNPCPIFGVYYMKAQFDIDKERTSLVNDQK
jgi:lipopolysaccharide transport system ATP-binding protein